MRAEAWPRRRSMWLDIGLTALAVAEAAVNAGQFGHRIGWGVPGAVVLGLVGLVAGTTLLFRRQLPLLPVVVALLVLPMSSGYLLLMIGVYTLGAYEWQGRAGKFKERRAMAALCGVALAETVTVSLITLGLGLNPDQQNHRNVPVYALMIISVMAAVGICVLPAILGLYIGQRRRLWEALTERAESLQRELTLVADRARERARSARMEERTRIAREMHDVVAHRVSLMVVHAGALERTAARDAERTAQGARLVGDIGRQALDELRQILGVLRTVEPDPGPDVVDPEADPVGGASADGASADGRSAPAADEPGLHAVAALVDELRAAGLGIRYTLGGTRRLLGAETERTAFRVVQEALTNVLKHAPGADAEVVVAYVPDGVALAVVNDCPKGDVPSRALPSGGNGLVGMRERVTALGGVFVAGPTDEGGFRVEARLSARLSAAEA